LSGITLALEVASSRNLEIALTNGEFTMKNKFLTLCVKIQNKLQSEEGQDLIEYALVVALIAFAATAGMKTLATGLNTAFANIANTLNSYTG
jgi:pilus assembly protein Flp/PilA